MPDHLMLDTAADRPPSLDVAEIKRRQNQRDAVEIRRGDIRHHSAIGQAADEVIQ